MNTAATSNCCWRIIIILICERTGKPALANTGPQGKPFYKGYRIWNYSGPLLLRSLLGLGKNYLNNEVTTLAGLISYICCYGNNLGLSKGDLNYEETVKRGLTVSWFFAKVWLDTNTILGWKQPRRQKATAVQLNNNFWCSHSNYLVVRSWETH